MRVNSSERKILVMEINLLMARARAVGLGPSDLARTAGVTLEEFERWTEGASIPGLIPYRRICATIKAMETSKSYAA